MRVLLLSDFYPPVTGGMERHVQTLGRELARRGHAVTVAALQHPAAPAFERDEGVNVHRIQTAWSRRLRRLYADQTRPFHPTMPDPGVARFLRRLIEETRPDVINARGWIVYSCLPAARGSRTPVVVTLHDYSQVCPKKTLLYHGERCSGPKWVKCVGCASGQYGWPRAAAITTGLQASAPLMEGVDRFVAVSRAVAEASSEHTRGKRVVVVPSFVPNGLEEEAAAGERLDSLPDDGYLLYVGSLGEHKGVDVLLSAYSRLRGAPPLVLVAPSHDARLLPDQPNVQVVLDVPHATVMKTWAGSSIGIVPSLWAEPFGQVAVEAMMMGKPVVASDVGGLKDIVVHESTGLLVRPGDATALAAALQRLIDDRALAIRLGRAGRQDATQFTVGAVCEQLTALFGEVVRSSRAA